MRHANLSLHVTPKTIGYIIMKRQFRYYQEKLLQDLQDQELASVYLSEALEDLYRILLIFTY